MQRRRSHWGWGYEDERPSPDGLSASARFLAGHLGFGFAVALKAAKAALDPGGRLNPGVLVDP